MYLCGKNGKGRGMGHFNIPFQNVPVKISFRAFSALFLETSRIFMPHDQGHSHPQRPHSIRSAPRIANSGILRVRSNKSYWLRIRLLKQLLCPCSKHWTFSEVSILGASVECYLGAISQTFSLEVITCYNARIPFTQVLWT